MSTSITPRLTHRFLGDSGLLVSRLSLGGWMLPHPSFSADGWYELMKVAFENGINLFDTAEFYLAGESEKYFGEAIKRGIADGVWTREDLVISTKGDSDFFQCGPNSQGISRKHLVEGTKRSLQRLQLDYVDIIFCHRSEPFTPMEEFVRAMNFIINQGWAFYWGTSEWLPSEIQEACDIADRLNLVRPVVEQPQYNILERSKVEFEYADLISEHKLGLTTWSPLMSGLLSGKYAVGAQPTGGRLENDDLRESVAPGFQDKLQKVEKLKLVAENVGCSLVQLSIAWCLTNENVTTVLLGAKNKEQLLSNMSALSFVDKITPEVKAEIDAIVQFTPQKAEHSFYSTLRSRHL